MRIVKDPAAALDYLWNWGDWLQAGETIVSFVITSAGGITLAGDKPAPAIVAGETLTTRLPVPFGAVLAWLRGGTASAPGSATCAIVTSAGREDARTITFEVRQR